MSLLNRLATLKQQEPSDLTQQEATKTPQIVDDFLGLLREVGLPPMILGAMRHAMKGISEAQIREMCARVGVGMFAIYSGGDVRASLDPTALTDDAVVARMVMALRGESWEVGVPEEEPLALET